MGVLQPPFLSTMPKRTEKDEKAISEIYKTLVTSFNPGKHPFCLNKARLASLSVSKRGIFRQRLSTYNHHRVFVERFLI